MYLVAILVIFVALSCNAHDGSSKAVEKSAQRALPTEAQHDSIQMDMLN